MTPTLLLRTLLFNSFISAVTDASVPIKDKIIAVIGIALCIAYVIYLIKDMKKRPKDDKL